MSYADLLNMTPVANRTSSDRMIMPRAPKKSRNSLTPDRNILISSSKCRLPPSPLRQSSESRFQLSRSSLSKKLFQTSSQEAFSGMIRRQSTGDFSTLNPPSGSLTNQRQLPTKPTKKIMIEGVSSDFYVSPLDWSKSQRIGFAVSGRLLFINPKNNEIQYAKHSPANATAVKYNNDGTYVAIGCSDGKLELYSILNQKVDSSYQISESTVLVSDWAENTIISGCKDRLFSVLDTRENEPMIYQNVHAEEICGTKFSPFNKNIIVTSSNDCSVKIWDLRNIENPITTYMEHVAAIRALAFSPKSENIIVTGGGTSDKNIKMWDINTGETISSIDTGSQVCNLFWNEEYNEIFSTHGFSQNHLALWKGSDLSPIAQFFEHKQRVLFMTASPDGSQVATVGPFDYMCIWQMFPSNRLSLTNSMQLVR